MDAQAAGRPEKKAMAIEPFVKSLGWRMNCTQSDSRAFVRKTMEKLKKLKANHASLFTAFVFEGLAHAVGEIHVDWVCEELAAKGGLDKDEAETEAQAEAKVVEEADDQEAATPAAEAKVVEEADDQEAATPASQAQTPIPMPATTPASTATTSTPIGQEEEAESSSQSQSPKSTTISRKRKKKTTTSTPQARLARALGPSSSGSVAFGSDVSSRRSQRAKK